VKNAARALFIIFLICGVATLPLLGSGCHPGGEPTPTPLPTASPTPTSTLAPAATLGQQSITLCDVSPSTLDPALSRDSTSHAYIFQLFSGLITIDRDLNLVPDIAESWDISNGDKTYTFHLRRGVNFHDGKAVTASDFKYSWERACDPQTKSSTAPDYLGDIVGVKDKLSGRAGEIGGIEVIDDYTLRVTIDAPKAYFLAKLTYPTAFVVDRANVESGDEWWRKPNGTGPFRLQEWQEDKLVVLERNPLYYGKPAEVGHVIFRLWSGIPMMMYEKGEIDVAPVGLDNLERVLDETNPLHRELQIVPQLSLQYVSFNSTKQPFDDPNIRRAFCHAVDKNKIISLTLKESCQRADGILPPGMPGYSEDVRGLDYDVALAKKLIADSKYGDVSHLPPIIITDCGRGSVPLYLQALIDMWRRNLGVEVTVRQLEPEAYFYRIKEEKDEMFISGWVADYPDPQNFLEVLFHSGSSANDSEYSNTVIDALLDKAAAEQDVSARMGMYQNIEQMLVDDAACLPLWFGRSYLLVKPYVKDYILTTQGVPLLSRVSIEPH
jgi:oligopeptide transport system substrate-binding protein